MTFFEKGEYSFYYCKEMVERILLLASSHSLPSELTFRWVCFAILGGGYADKEARREEWRTKFETASSANLVRFIEEQQEFFPKEFEGLFVALKKEIYSSFSGAVGMAQFTKSVFVLPRSEKPSSEKKTIAQLRHEISCFTDFYVGLFFHCGNLLGKGGQGAVYGVGPFAIKLMPLSDKQKDISPHVSVPLCPGIVPDLGSKISKFGQCTFMPFISGKTLSLCSLDSIGYWNVFLNMAKTCQMLHNLGVVYGDIKPSNVMIIDNSYDPMMIDYGTVAKKNTIFSGKGTPKYFSPVLSISWGRQDQYAYGMMLAFSLLSLLKIERLEYTEDYCFEYLKNNIILFKNIICWKEFKRFNFEEEVVYSLLTALACICCAWSSDEFPFSEVNKLFHCLSEDLGKAKIDKREILAVYSRLSTLAALSYTQSVLRFILDDGTFFGRYFDNPALLERMTAFEEAFKQYVDYKPPIISSVSKLSAYGIPDAPPGVEKLIKTTLSYLAESLIFEQFLIKRSPANFISVTGKYDLHRCIKTLLEVLSRVSQDSLAPALVISALCFTLFGSGCLDLKKRQQEWEKFSQLLPSQQWKFFVETEDLFDEKFKPLLLLLQGILLNPTSLIELPEKLGALSKSFPEDKSFVSVEEVRKQVESVSDDEFYKLLNAAPRGMFRNIFTKLRIKSIDLFLKFSAEQGSVEAIPLAPGIISYLGERTILLRMGDRPFYLTIMPDVGASNLHDMTISDLGVIVRTGHSLFSIMRYAHFLGFAHCDIKPVNIMRSASGLLSVIDWDLSCPSEKTAELCQGTRGYLPPSIWNIDLISPITSARLDLFSSGITLADLIVGKSCDWGKMLRFYDTGPYICLMNKAFLFLCPNWSAVSDTSFSSLPMLEKIQRYLLAIMIANACTLDANVLSFSEICELHKFYLSEQSRLPSAASLSSSSSSALSPDEPELLNQWSFLSVLFILRFFEKLLECYKTNTRFIEKELSAVLQTLNMIEPKILGFLTDFEKCFESEKVPPSSLSAPLSSSSLPIPISSSSPMPISSSVAAASKVPSLMLFASGSHGEQRSSGETLVRETFTCFSSATLS